MGGGPPAGTVCRDFFGMNDKVDLEVIYLGPNETDHYCFQAYRIGIPFSAKPDEFSAGYWFTSTREFISEMQRNSDDFSDEVKDFLSDEVDNSD